MHKIFVTRYEFLYSTLKTYSKTPNFLLPISNIHGISKAINPNSKLDYVTNEVETLSSSTPRNEIAHESLESNELYAQIKHTIGNESMVQILHPWPEWVDLMELLLKRGYFETNENPFINGELGTKETNWIRTACLNFARDQFALIRFFSRRDIHIITACGCPSLDRKVINSGKRLRAHVGIDEGNVCSSCKLRGDCERAYVKAREDEGGRTVDVMRVLLTYGLDSISGAPGSKLLQNKMVKESVRRLLNEVVELSSNQHDSDFLNGIPFRNEERSQGHPNIPTKPGDWHCPKCNFLNFARNIRCLRCDGLFQDRLKRLHEDQDHLPLKKGDWICEKCNFLNFAKNTRCLQCKEKPPKRPLNPGEWECESCNYINFRRNTVCLKCDHRRPKSLNSPNKASEQDKGDYPKHGRLRFNNGENEASDDKSEVSGGRINQRKHVHMWRFVDEGEDCRLSLHDEDSRFIDFPIMGGRSNLSRNEQNRERWKVEMLEKSQKRTTRSRQGDDENKYDDTRGTFKFLGNTDNEDMAEWFGHVKKRE